MARDIDFFTWIATWVERLQPGFRRLRPIAVVETFAPGPGEMDLRLGGGRGFELAENFAAMRVPRTRGRLAAHRAPGADAGAGQRDPVRRARRPARRRLRARPDPRPAAERSSSRCSATASSMATCIPATSSSTRRRPGAGRLRHHGPARPADPPVPGRDAARLPVGRLSAGRRRPFRRRLCAARTRTKPRSCRPAGRSPSRSAAGRWPRSRSAGCSGSCSR